MHTTRFILLALTLLCTPLPGATDGQAPENLVRKALLEQPLDDAEQKQLVSLIFGDKKELLRAIESIDDETLATRLAKLKAFLNADPSEDYGKNRLGAAVGWHLTYAQGKHLTSYPVLSKVIEGGVADQSGLFLGDVVFNLATVHIAHHDSRNRFMLFLQIWPRGQAIEFTVLSANKPAPLKDLRTKENWKRIKVTFNE